MHDHPVRVIDTAVDSVFELAVTATNPLVRVEDEFPALVVTYVVEHDERHHVSLLAVVRKRAPTLDITRE